MQIQIWSRSRATPKGTSAISLTQQSSVCPLSPSSGEMFISMGFCSPRCMSEDNGGKGLVRREEGLKPLLCKSHLLHRYHVVTRKYEIITLNFNSGRCGTLVCTSLVPAGKRGVGLTMAGKQVTACAVGTGPGRYPTSPATCNPSPRQSIGAGGPLQQGQSHHDRTFPGHVSTPLPTLPPTQLLVQGVKPRYHSDNFRLSC